MAPTPAPFRLSATLAGHSADVRSLTSPSSSGSPTANAALFSSSRDGTARSWVHDAAGSDGWKEGRAVEGAHEGFVNAVVWLSGGEKNAGFLVTAGQDKLIHIYPLPSSLSLSDSPDLSALKPTHTLIGHDNNVCALGASSDGERIVSGSWDKTAMVWKDFQLAYTLSGHAQAVWAVLPLDGPDDLVLTGAADNLIKLWRKDKEEITFKGHTQAVRALAKLDKGVGEGDLFASAGNDATIRLWSLSRGDQIHVLNGHDSFVYSLAAIPDAFGGGLVSGGEDRTMRVWRAADGSCEQTIVIPAVSVWTVACLGNGDIAAGSSDGLIRVFTRQESRVADLEALTAFDRDVSTTALNSTQVGDVKKADLPGIEALGRPGEKDGAVKMIRSPEDTIQAYSWTSATSTWQQIGEVVDAVGSNRKQLYMGHEYDHVFDVDFKDGAQPLKLPYNVTMNPYEAAQRFLQANELPAEYTDQVVQFIERSTAGVTLGTSTSEFVDPYTGASRYTGGGSGSTPAPMTGGFAGDPYTGGGATAAPTAPSLLPHKTCLSFTAVNLPALRKKLGELNDSLAADPSTASLALNESDLASLELLVNARPGVFLAEGASAVASKMLLWPSSLRFPSIDLVRYVSLSTPLSETIPSLLSTIQDTSAPLKEQETNTMLAFRALANMFYTKTGKATMKDEAEEIIDTLKRRGFVGVSKNGKIALSTVVLNYSVIAVQKSLDASAGPGLFELVAELLRDVDGEVVYRSLVALGNLLLSPQIVAGLPSAGIERYKNLAKSAASRLPEARNKAVVVEIERVR